MKDKTPLHETFTAKTQPHKSDEVKDKTLPHDIITTKTQPHKSDEELKIKSHLHDTDRIYSHKSDEKVEVYNTFIITHTCLFNFLYIFYIYLYI